VYRSAVAKNGSSPGATCESCGETDGPFAPVHRVYLETDDEGGLRPGEAVAEVERWCPACRAVYPHEPAPG
jgi:hypothetical protein